MRHAYAYERWIPEVTLADRLRMVRRAHGRDLGRPFTQSEMAELIGVTRIAYQQWEAGNNGPRDLWDIAWRIEEALGADATWLAAGS